MLKTAEEHLRAGRLPQALGICHAILSAQPNDPGALHLAGVVAHQLDEPEDALALISQAIRIDPRPAVYHANLGIALHRLGRLQQALASFARAIAADPRHVDAHYNRGAVLAELGELNAAQHHFQRVIALEPQHAFAHYALGLALLQHGEFARGWAEHEWRRRGAKLTPDKLVFREPLWDGRPLGGRTILLHAEQGLGDTIQFARYAPLVAARGGRVLLACQPSLKRLLTRLDGVEAVLTGGDRLPAFDVQAPLMSLPHLLGTTVETIPARVPYLAVDDDLNATWAERLRGMAGLKVGLVWAGNPANPHDRRRSMALASLAPLAAVSGRGVTLVSLQKGPAAAEAATPPDGLRLIDLGPELNDLADTAAVVSQLDLVISVDTAVAHLAGALGRPVWLLLSHVHDWRWLVDRADTPWYPSMRLLHQRRPDDWDSVVTNVVAALHALLG